MTKRDITKTIAKFVVGTSVGYTVSSAIANNAPANNTLQKTEVVVGSYVVGAMVAESTEDWTYRKVDAIFDFFEGSKKN